MATASHPLGEPRRREASLFDRVGGEGFFRSLVAHFYAGVAEDPVLLPLYPEPDDLAPAADRLCLFLMQYWGGPTTYSEQRGHPRLRLRHAPYRVGPVERDAWLTHMVAAVGASGVGDPERSELLAYFEMVAHHLQNSDA